MRPCFENSKVTPKVGHFSKIPCVHSGGENSMDKPWFNEELKEEISYKSFYNVISTIVETKKTN